MPIAAMPSPCPMGPSFSFVTTAIPNGDVRYKDRFQRIANGTIYEVSQVMPDGVNRTRAHLVELPDNI